MNPATPACELCEGPGGALLWQNGFLRVVAVDDENHPGFCRVIVNRHVKELTDLVPEERSALMTVVCKVEAAMREILKPDKMNLASLGNMTPHVHWHVIARFRDDRHFPGPVWAAPQRDTPVPAERRARVALLASTLASRLERG